MRQQVGFLRGSAEAAKGALRVATQQYNQGATDFTTVLVAEQNLLQGGKQPGCCHGFPLWPYRGVSRAWRRMADKEDGNFVDAATRDQMRARTNWGSLLRPLANRNHRLPVCPVLTILGRLSDRRDGEVAENFRAGISTT